MRRVKKALLPRIHALRQLPFLGLLLLVACEEGLTPVSFEGISGKVAYNGEVPDATEWVRVVVYADVPTELDDFIDLLALSDTLGLEAPADSYVVTLDPGAYDLVLSFWKRIDAPLTELRVGGWYTRGDPPFGEPAAVLVIVDEESPGIDLTMDYDSLLSLEQALERLK